MATTAAAQNAIDHVIARFRRAPLSTDARHRGSSNLYVSAHPISGNTWISSVVTYCLNCQFYDVDRDDLSPFTEGFRTVLSGENDHRSSARFDRVLKTHAMPSRIAAGPTDRILVVIRDVRDVANSYYFRTMRRWPESPDWKRRFAVGVASRYVPRALLYDFSIRFFARRWAEFAEDALRSDALIVRYEEMLEAPFDTLRRIITEWDADTWDADIGQRALDTFSLSEMRKQAEKGGPNHPIRSGGAGDWRNHFSEELSVEIAKRYGQLMARLGYELEAT